MLRIFGRTSHRLLINQLCTSQSAAISGDSDTFGGYAGPSESKPISKRVRGLDRSTKTDQNRSRQRHPRSNEKEPINPADVFGTLAAADESNEAKIIVDYKTNAKYTYDEDDVEPVRAKKDGRRSALEEDAEKAEKLFDEPEVRPFVVAKHTPEYFAQLQRKLGNEGKIAEMVAVIEKRMREDRVRPTRWNFREAITYLGRYGQPRKAFDLYQYMKRLEIGPNAPITASLFNACANCSPVEKEWSINQAKLLLSDLRGQYGQLNMMQYHGAIKAFGRHGELGLAFQVADFMVMDRMKPDGETFNHLLQACISDQDSGFKLALDLWRAMHAYGLKADTYFYNGVLRACRDCGLGPLGNRVMDELASEETKLREKVLQHETNERHRLTDPEGGAPVPTLQELTEKLDQLEIEDDPISEPVENRNVGVVPIRAPETNFKLALLRGVHGVLKLMDRDRAKPNVKTFSLLLDMLPVSNVDDETWLMESMLQRRVNPDVDFLNAIIARRCRRYQFDSALALLQEFKIYDLAPNQRTFSSLAVGCKTYTTGISLLRDIEALGIQPNMHVLVPLLYNSLIHNHRFDFFYAMNVLNRMRKFKLNVPMIILKFLESSKKKAEEIEEKRKMQTLKHPRANDSEDGLPRVRGLQEFLIFYEQWLKSMQVEDNVDPKLTLLDKEVTADDVREDWEKPWVAQAQEQKELENLERYRMIPVE